MRMLPVAALLLAAALLVLPAHPRRGLLLRSNPGKATFPAVISPALLVLAVSLSASPAVATVAAGAAVLVQWRRRGVHHRAERRREGEAMTAALETVVGELRVGAHPLAAFGIAAAESSGTVGTGLRTVTARVGLGADIVAGLRAVAEQSAVPFYWDRIAICWQLASNHGLTMATLMRAAQRDIVDRQRFSSRVDAGLAGSRATATVLAALPVLGILLGELIGAHPVQFLLHGEPGGWLLIAGTGLIAAGVLWSDHIVNRLAI